MTRTVEVFEQKARELGMPEHRIAAIKAKMQRPIKLSRNQRLAAFLRFPRVPYPTGVL